MASHMDVPRVLHDPWVLLQVQHHAPEKEGTVAAAPPLRSKRSDEVLDVRHRALLKGGLHEPVHVLPGSAFFKVMLTFCLLEDNEYRHSLMTMGPKRRPVWRIHVRPSSETTCTVMARSSKWTLTSWKATTELEDPTELRKRSSALTYTFTVPFSEPSSEKR
eukprot:CAMPEP_0179175218 /NCGR_PEP_ID=MMETSP0796-20121207/86525_1 /TAXON_ID=73915 /ORGANISM="Pyrodinium bahamense, Strain pbaha01" /LENGTH=161 /DNA_ID=CAMNT_0020878539 /DNA_START=25 /DNA_END=511 /DNA_ORIENTATION=-